MSRMLKEIGVDLYENLSSLGQESRFDESFVFLQPQAEFMQCESPMNSWCLHV